MLSEDGIPRSFNLTVRGRAGTKRAAAEIHHYRWTRPQQQTYLDGRHCVDMVLSHRPPQAKGQFAGERSKREIGKIIFLPNNRAVEAEWAAGEQQSVCCSIDPSLISDHAAPLDGCLDVRDDLIRSAMSRIACEVLSPGFASTLLIESLCQSILLARLGEVEASPKIHQRLSRLHLTQIDEMLDNEGAAPEVADLAATCGLSTRHFTRLFRAATGKSVGDYAAERRMARAMALLAGGRMLIKEVAWRCGFENIPSFSAAFRRMTGITPSAFRALH